MSFCDECGRYDGKHAERCLGAEVDRLQKRVEELEAELAATSGAIGKFESEVESWKKYLPIVRQMTERVKSRNALLEKVAEAARKAIPVMEIGQPGDELIKAIRALDAEGRAANEDEENNEGDTPSPDGSDPSTSTPVGA